MMTPGTAEADIPAAIDVQDPQQLEHLERQLTGLLYALWRAQGKRKKIVIVQRQVYETKQ